MTISSFAQFLVCWNLRGLSPLRCLLGLHWGLTGRHVCVCVQIWVAEPSGREDLCTLVLAYLQGTVPHPPLDGAVNFYQAAKAAAVRGDPLQASVAHAHTRCESKL